jgi:butyrate kinase
VLDVLDTQEENITVDVDSVVPNEKGEQNSRFKQIFHMLSQRNKTRQYSNSPQTGVEDIESVTTRAGGGVNGSKHIADIRGEHGRLYGDN